MSRQKEIQDFIKEGIMYKNDELEKKAIDFLCGKLVKVDSDSDIISIVSRLSGMFPDSFDIGQEISNFNRLVKKGITYTALGCMFGIYVVAFFHYDFYTKLRIREGGRRTVFAYVCNTQMPDCSEYGSVYVSNYNGEYYFTYY